MKFFKWLQSLFVPIECKVEPQERYTLKKLVDGGGTSLDMVRDLGVSLSSMLTNAHWIYPMTLTMNPYDTTMHVIDKFKEINPSVTINILEHNDLVITFCVSFLDKEVEFKWQYMDRN